MELPFPSRVDKSKPLAERMRPRTLDEFLGQDAIIGPGTLLRTAIEQKRLPQSLILWGPPGCGKTTLARIIANQTQTRFASFSAVTTGIAEVKRVIADAARMRAADARPLLVFVDEIHRFNKAQQDAFLPHIESGTIVLVGATTQNPSFEVIGPLLSRSRVLVLETLSEEHIARLLERALADGERGLGDRHAVVAAEDVAYLARAAGGDARVALNALEYAVTVVARDGSSKTVTRRHLEDALQRPIALTDKGGDAHYDLISAFIKSLRGSDVDASLYWLARMCEAGEDPLFIARRLVILASEDIGNADPHALPLAVAARDAVDFVGYPECKLTLAQAVTYLALAPKSNASYLAYKNAAAAVGDRPAEPVPLHLRNAPTPLAKGLGHGKGYKYPHDYPGAFADQSYLPDSLGHPRFYEPKDAGFEIELGKRLDAYRARRNRQK